MLRRVSSQLGLQCRSQLLVRSDQKSVQWLGLRQYAEDGENKGFKGIFAALKKNL